MLDRAGGIDLFRTSHNLIYVEGGRSFIPNARPSSQQLEGSHRVSENLDIDLDLNGIEAVLDKSSPSFDDNFSLGSNLALLFNDNGNALCSATPSAAPSAMPSATPSLDPCRVRRFEPLFKPLYSASSKQISACKANLSFDACCSELSESSGSSGESTGADEWDISQSASSSPIHELIWD